MNRETTCSSEAFKAGLPVWRESFDDDEVGVRPCWASLLCGQNRCGYSQDADRFWARLGWERFDHPEGDWRALFIQPARVVLTSQS